ncbi:MAG: hypothetical protein LUC33_05990 [Prevotellaceae bacterium]|nr:hypothetical protein [Prevotellaceae bacterium]
MEAEKMAAKNLKYFMVDNTDEVIEVPGLERFKDADGNVVPLKIKVLSQAEISKINKNYRRKSIATDRKGDYLTANGEVVWKNEWDGDKATRHIIVEALQEPDLADKEIMEYYHCVDVTEMPEAVFSRHGEYEYVVDVVFRALGLRKANSDEDDLEAAKNS